MIKEVTINQAIIQSTRSRFDKTHGRLATIITIETHIPPGEIAELLKLQSTSSPVHLVIKSYQSELPLKEAPDA